MKRNIFKKCLAGAMALSMAAGMAACGGSGSSAPATDAAGKPDTSQFVTVKMLVLGNKPTNGRMEAAVAEENKLLKEKVNANIELSYIEWADWQTKYQLQMASNDGSVDLITTATDWLYAWPSVRKGAFKELSEDMLKTYAPKTYAAVPKEDWELCTLDDKIYFIPENQFTQWTNQGFYYRGDWAKEVGLEKAEKFEDLETYLKGVKKNHAGVVPWDVAGKNNLGGLLGGYLGSKTDTNAILGCDTGNFNLFAYKEGAPYTVMSPWMEGKELEDAAVMFKRWNDEGFWREDVLNYDGETRDLMYAGKSGADAHHTMTWYTTTRPQMAKKQPGSDLKFYYFGQENKNVNRDLKTHGAMAVAASSKNAERALMVYDLMRNDKQIYQLHNMGIEGKDYVMNKDGTLGRPEGWDSTKDALETNFWGGRMDAFEPDQDIWDIEAKKQISKELDGIAKEYPLTKFAFVSDAVQSQMAAMAEVCTQYLPSLAYGRDSDPKAKVAEFRQALKDAGYEQVKAEIQRQLDELKASEGK